jgi:hypothetical protein
MDGGYFLDNMDGCGIGLISTYTDSPALRVRAVFITCAVFGDNHVQNARKWLLRVFYRAAQMTGRTPIDRRSYVLPSRRPLRRCSHGREERE